MTYEEARKWVLGCLYHDCFIETKRFDIANDVIKDALEKQIPKKPIVYVEEYYYACPNDECTNAINRCDSFCPRCSQAIDWSE